jgi:hypothetical protein
MGLMHRRVMPGMLMAGMPGRVCMHAVLGSRRVILGLGQRQGRQQQSGKGKTRVHGDLQRLVICAAA